MFMWSAQTLAWLRVGTCLLALANWFSDRIRPSFAQCEDGESCVRNLPELDHHDEDLDPPITNTRITPSPGALHFTGLSVGVETHPA